MQLINETLKNGINPKIVAAAIALMILFPPYIVYGYHGSVKDYGYSFIFNLPGNNFSARIDIGMILVQITAVILISYFIALSKNK